jgi:hypothetical protein
MIKKNAKGLFIGRSATRKLGFYGTTPVVQPSGSSQAAIGTLTTTALSGALTGTLTGAIADLPTIGDSPASADALRDDIVANVVPVVNKNFKEFQDRLNCTVIDLGALKTLVNALRAASVSQGQIKGSA